MDHADCHSNIAGLRGRGGRHGFCTWESCFCNFSLDITPLHLPQSLRCGMERPLQPILYMAGTRSCAVLRDEEESTEHRTQHRPSLHRVGLTSVGVTFCRGIGNLPLHFLKASKSSKQVLNDPFTYTLALARIVHSVV